MRPFLAATAEPVPGRRAGHTVVTESRPETSDESEAEPAYHPSGADFVPWLVTKAEFVDGTLNGKTILTKAMPETSDEGDDAD